MDGTSVCGVKSSSYNLCCSPSDLYMPNDCRGTTIITSSGGGASSSSGSSSSSE